VRARARRPWRLRLSRPRGDSGSVTAELALALPTLMLVVAVGIWMQSAVALQARCLDAARAGARAAARGDPDGTIRAALAPSLPSGAGVAVIHAGSQVTVTVRVALPVPAGLSSLVSAPAISSSATAITEQP
jgi:Flp pilus assembly protein TadG